jgi:hypothetical protein
MITERDKEILQFINVFGKTYYEVLAVTFFKNDQVARNRIAKLMKDKVIGYLRTGLESPRRALTLGRVGKDYIDVELGEYVKVPKISNTTVHHNIIEQIVYYHLSQIGSIERTTIATHHKLLNHIPDLIYTTNRGTRIYIEVEITKKSNDRYKEIMRKIIKDKPDKLLYISDTHERAKSIVESIGYWGEKIMYIDIESFVKNITETKKVSPHTHKNPNARPAKIIAQQPKTINIIEHDNKEILKEPDSVPVAFEKIDNVKTIEASNNIQNFNEEKPVIKNIELTRYTKFLLAFNNITDELSYRFNTVIYASVLVAFYGGGGYGLWKISGEVFKLIDTFL